MSPDFALQPRHHHSKIQLILEQHSTPRAYQAFQDLLSSPSLHYALHYLSDLLSASIHCPSPLPAPPELVAALLQRLVVLKVDPSLGRDGGISLIRQDVPSTRVLLDSLLSVLLDGSSRIRQPDTSVVNRLTLSTLSKLFHQYLLFLDAHSGLESHGGDALAVFDRLLFAFKQTSLELRHLTLESQMPMSSRISGRDQQEEVLTLSSNRCLIHINLIYELVSSIYSSSDGHLPSQNLFCQIVLNRQDVVYELLYQNVYELWVLQTLSNNHLEQIYLYSVKVMHIFTLHVCSSGSSTNEIAQGWLRSVLEKFERTVEKIISRVDCSPAGPVQVVQGLDNVLNGYCELFSDLMSLESAHHHEIESFYHNEIFSTFSKLIQPLSQLASHNKALEPVLCQALKILTNYFNPWRASAPLHPVPDEGICFLVNFAVQNLLVIKFQDGVIPSSDVGVNDDQELNQPVRSPRGFAKNLLKSVTYRYSEVVHKVVCELLPPVVVTDSRSLQLKEATYLTVGTLCEVKSTGKALFNQQSNFNCWFEAWIDKLFWPESHLEPKSFNQQLVYKRLAWMIGKFLQCPGLTSSQIHKAESILFKLLSDYSSTLYCTPKFSLEIQKICLDGLGNSASGLSPALFDQNHASTMDCILNQLGIIFSIWTDVAHEDDPYHGQTFGGFRRLPGLMIQAGYQKIYPWSDLLFKLLGQAWLTGPEHTSSSQLVEQIIQLIKVLGPQIKDNLPCLLEFLKAGYTQLDSQQDLSAIQDLNKIWHALNEQFLELINDAADSLCLSEVVQTQFTLSVQGLWILLNAAKACVNKALVKGLSVIFKQAICLWKISEDHQDSHGGGAAADALIGICVARGKGWEKTMGFVIDQVGVGNPVNWLAGWLPNLVHLDSDQVKMIMVSIGLVDYAMLRSLLGLDDYQQENKFTKVIFFESRFRVKELQIVLETFQKKLPTNFRDDRYHACTSAPHQLYRVKDLSLKLIQDLIRLDPTQYQGADQSRGFEALWPDLDRWLLQCLHICEQNHEDCESESDEVLEEKDSWTDNCQNDAW